MDYHSHRARKNQTVIISLLATLAGAFRRDRESVVVIRHLEHHCRALSVRRFEGKGAHLRWAFAPVLGVVLERHLQPLPPQPA